MAFTPPGLCLKHLPPSLPTPLIWQTLLILLDSVQLSPPPESLLRTHYLLCTQIFPCLPFSLDSTNLGLCGSGGGRVTKSCLTLVSPWTVAHQAPLSMECSRQEHWSWLPFPSPGDLPDPGSELTPPTLQAVSCIPSRFLTTEPPGKSLHCVVTKYLLLEKSSRGGRPMQFTLPLCKGQLYIFLSFIFTFSFNFKIRNYGIVENV